MKCQHAYWSLANASLSEGAVKKALECKESNDFPSNLSWVANWHHSASFPQDTGDSFRKGLMCPTLSTTMKEVMGLQLPHHSWYLFGKGFHSHPVGISSPENKDRSLGISTRDDKATWIYWCGSLKRATNPLQVLPSRDEIYPHPFLMDWPCDSLWLTECWRGNVWFPSLGHRRLAWAHSCSPSVGTLPQLWAQASPLEDKTKLNRDEAS